MQDIMEDEDMEFLPITELTRFWWLSSDGAVREVADIYPTLYLTPEHDALKQMGLFNKVKCITIVLVTDLLRDVLSVVLKVSTVFLMDLIDIETVNIMVDATAMKINQLKY